MSPTIGGRRAQPWATMSAGPSGVCAKQNAPPPDLLTLDSPKLAIYFVKFILVFELVNDLVSFVGQKCRQSFSQRGKSLLNE